jgi:hypothetical protein
MLSQMYTDLKVKYLSVLSHFNQTTIFPIDFRSIQISNLLKIRPVRTELFHADRQTEEQTDMTRTIVTFRNFANAPKKSTFSSKCIYVFCMDIRRNKDYFPTQN